MDKLFRDIFEGFKAQPVRAGFSILAVCVGAATLSLLIAILASLEATSERLVSELGANAIVGVSDPGSAPGLRQQHAKLIRANFPGLLVSTVGRSETEALGSSGRLQVVATDSFLARARGWRMIDGRFLDARDIAFGKRHVVITHRVAAEWGWRVGNVVMLGNLPFVVIGVVRTQGSALAGQYGNPELVFGERLVFVPRTVPAPWSDDYAGSGDTMQALFVKAPEESDPSVVLGAIQNLLSGPGVMTGSISWVTPETLVQRIDRLKAVIGGVAATVSLLCLVLGGTTLMSLMVTNIRERVTEIGLRLTLGATRSEVAALFVSESLVLALIGALVGTSLAHLLIALAAPVLPIRIVTGWSSWGLPIAACLFFSLAFAYGPAMRAAGVSPAAALRTE